jgi:iron-sulfur cluster repair protein YtfE (RIC family)
MATPEMMVSENDAAGETPRFETATAYLSWDHERLDRILDAAVSAVAEGRFAPARAAFKVFAVGLHRHIGLEESLMFPLFEARTGLVDGPVSAMREEHRVIQNAVATMREALHRSDAPAFADGLRFLHSMLAVHESKEEHVLYPITDALLTQAEARMLVARLERE